MTIGCCRFSQIMVPLNVNQVESVFQTHIEWQITLSNFVGKLDNHYPKFKHIQVFKQHSITLDRIIYKMPIPNASMYFTDASSNGKIGNGKMVKICRFIFFSS